MLDHVTLLAVSLTRHGTRWRTEMKFESPRMTNANIGKSGVCFLLHMHGVQYEAERCELYRQIQADCGCTRCNAPAIFVRNVQSIKIDVQKIYMDLKFGTCTKSTVLFGGRVTFFMTTCISLTCLALLEVATTHVQLTCSWVTQHQPFIFLA